MGAFRVTSYHVKRYQFVTYEYQSNPILVQTLIEQMDESLLETFQDVYEYLAIKGFKPNLNVMNNSAATQSKTSSLQQRQTINMSTQMITKLLPQKKQYTYGKHWIMGKGTLTNCPMQLQCQFVEGRDSPYLNQPLSATLSVKGYSILTRPHWPLWEQIHWTSSIP